MNYCVETNFILPWQYPIWQSLMQCKNVDRLPHALLLLGIPGVGKAEFARAFSQAILCSAPLAQAQACGQCRPCRLLAGNSHPDLMWIMPEEGSRVIKIDQIREVVHFINSTPLLGGYRVVILNPASAMNTYAANALLKTLEEPTPNVVFLLLHDQKSRLPATIMSRCQRVLFPVPTREVALNWLGSEISGEELDLADGAPLQAKLLHEKNILALRQDFYQGLNQLGKKQLDPIKFAATCQEKEVDLLFLLLFRRLKELLLSADNKSTLLDYINHVQKAYAHVSSSLNLNKQLLLEDLFIRWVPLCS